MKTTIFTTFVVLFSNIIAFAQSGVKWDLGGNPAASGSFLGTTNNVQLFFRTNNAQHMVMNGLNNFNPSIVNGNNTGYIGIGNANNTPSFNVHVITQALASGGEVFFGGNPSFAINSDISLMNLSGTQAVFYPGLMGNLQSNQTNPALALVSNIHPTQDLFTNKPVEVFMVGKGFSHYTSGISGISELTDRIAFTWQNAGNVKMMMDADGRLKIGNSLIVPTDRALNRFEVTASAGTGAAPADPYFNVVATNGASGLRLTNLTSAKTPLTSGTNGVNPNKLLSVDINGDVVLVSAIAPPPPPGLGNLCSSTLNPILGDYQIPMNGFNFNFTSSSGSKSQVNIGDASCVSSQGQLNVNGDNFGLGIYSRAANTNFANNIGIQGIGVCIPNNSSATMISAGLVGETGPGGVLGQQAVGVAAYAAGPSNLSTIPIGAGIGLYGNSTANNGAWAGYFDGNVNFNGNVVGSQWGWVSDQTFKTNIDTINNALAILKRLKPRSYYFDTTNIYKMKLPFQKQYGLIAQDVYTVMPELVTTQIRPSVRTSSTSAPTPSLAYKALNYNAFTAIMIRAIQQLSDQNRKQDSLIKTLINCCKENSGNQNSENKSGINTNTPFNNIQNQLNVELSDKDIVMLSQNEPNPFAESCVIEYNIPMDFKFAQIVFNNLDGKIIKTVDILQKGKGQLNVFASDLSNGLYGYYLLIDGKITESKKLIKQN